MSSGNPPAAAAPAPDWRKSVLQSYRSSEVREISKVLAALEGSASVTPASKLMLAMRFEDQIFKSAKDLADYRKKISKRLKKLKKNYVAAPKTTGPAKGSVKSANGASSSSTASKSKDEEERQELSAKLKRDYGDKLAYIVKSARAAVVVMQQKLGPEKALQLKQHTDSCRLWARDLDILTEKELDAIPNDDSAAKVVDNNNNTSKAKEDEGATKKNSSESDPKQQQQQSQSQSQPQSQQQPPKPQEPAPKSPDKMSNKAIPQSLKQLQRIEHHLKTRVANIRSYVVKNADPDQFLLESLQTRDVSFSKNVNAGNMLRDALRYRLSSHREMLQKATNASNNTTTSTTSTTNLSSENDNPLLVLQKSLEKAQVGVPPPTRNDSMQLEGSLVQLDKMRAASTAMMTYWTLAGDQRLQTAPRDTLKKVHEVALEGADFVLKGVRNLEKEKQKRLGKTTSPATTGDSSSSSTSNKKVSLQDAWSKSIELPSSTAPINVDEEENSSSSGNNKRQRTNSYKPYFKTRMIFRPNRKTPQPLLMAIRRKGADLKPASPTNAIPHLVLHFDDAFLMTIYFSPLMVTIRAKSPRDNDTSAVCNNNNSGVRWTPISHGLTPWGETLDSSDFLRKQQHNEHRLSVWGVTSGYESIGRVVEERLRDASTHATATLRKCFKNHVKDKTVSFEVELLEGSALLEFLQLTRMTYMPHWEDEDVM